MSPSRRELLALLSLATLGGCLPFRPCRCLTPEDAHLIRALADAIAPGGEGLPSASAAGADRALARRIVEASPEEKAMIGRGFARLRERAPGAAALAITLAELDPECFEWLRRRTFEALYGSPHAQGIVLGRREGRAPRP